MILQTGDVVAPFLVYRESLGAPEPDKIFVLKCTPTVELIAQMGLQASNTLLGWPASS